MCQVAASLRELRLQNRETHNVAIGITAGAETSYAAGRLKVQTETRRRCGPAETLQEVGQALRGVTIAFECKCMPQVAKILLVVTLRS